MKGTYRVTVKITDKMLPKIVEFILDCRKESMQSKAFHSLGSLQNVWRC